MRYWQEYLIGNAAAFDDFVKWSRDAETSLQIVLTKAVQDGDTEKAKGIAHEIKVYENLRTKISAEMREQSSQAQYSEQVERRLQ